jgi:hypothetical protein
MHTPGVPVRWSAGEDRDCGGHDSPAPITLDDIASMTGEFAAAGDSDGPPGEHGGQASRRPPSLTGHRPPKLSG